MMIKVMSTFYCSLQEKIVQKTIEDKIHAKKYIQQLHKMAHKILNLTQSSQSVIFQKKQQLDEQMSASNFGFLVIALISTVITNKNKLRVLEQNNLQKRLIIITKIVKSFLEHFSKNTRTKVDSLFSSGRNGSAHQRLSQQIKKCKMPEDVQKHAMRELKRLQKTQMTRSSQSSYIQNYLDVLTQLPWSIQDPQVKDIKRAKKILDQDHYGLENVKKRILEHIAVKQLKADNKSATILCFVGPPGVGKTSLGKSIARALGKKFDRISLGGVSDHSFMRGHRKTYVGAMPGQFIQSLKKIKTKNPVILLDEIDKIGTRQIQGGDPSSALLEILDPNQNESFKDHYLEVKFDLSKQEGYMNLIEFRIMFIATANTLETIQPALLDRMEIIQLTGYSIQQKIEIAKRYLIPDVLKKNGLQKEEVKFTDQILSELISKYTMETGCRGLNRVIGSIIRGIAFDIIDSKKKKRKQIKLEFSRIVDYLGPPKFNIDQDQTINRSGVSLGLATSSLGGSLLVIETAAYPGQGQFHLTGKLGDCLKQSVMTAISWMRSNIEFIQDIFGPVKLRHLDINKKKKQDVQKQNQNPVSEKIQFQQSTNQNSCISSSSPISPSGLEFNKIFKNLNIHVHFPSAATPKDGPSAGITILIALISLITGVPVRKDVAMTGELSLQGQILPIGGDLLYYPSSFIILGVKEKCLAAHRSAIRKVLLPVANGLQTVQISDDIKRELEIVLVDKVEIAVKQAFSQDEIRKNSIKEIDNREYKPRL